MTAALYEIVAAYKQDVAMLEELDIDDQTFIDTLEGMQGDLQAKATSVGAFIRNLEASASAIKEAEATMSNRRKALENKAKRINAYLLGCMQAAGMTRIESPYFVLAIKSNPPAVQIDDERQIPADYWKDQPMPPKTIDKTLIKQSIRDGFNVPGASLVQSVRLEVR